MATTWTPGVVWTEREGDIPGTPMNEGDWEACVAASYSMALLYGGVQMAAPYTQRQRELIEIHGAAADLPQDLAASDTMSMRVYGVKLRGATPGLTAAQALGRPGIGMCLTTNNSPGGYGTGFVHEVFWVGVSETAGLLYDPLAPAGSQPQSRTVAYMLPFLRGLGDNQLREVKKDEFAAATGDNMPIIEAMQGLPDGASIQIAPREYQFFWFDPDTGARSSFKHVFTAASSAGTEGVVDLKGEGPAYFLPKCYVGAAGMKTNVYLPVGYVRSDEVYVPQQGGGFTQKDLEDAETKGKVAGAAERDKQWEAKIALSHHP